MFEILFLTKLMAAIAATPVDPRSCEGAANKNDGRLIGTLSEGLQRFWSYLHLKFLEGKKLIEAHEAEHNKPGYKNEKCKEAHAAIEKLDAERSLLSAIFWEAVRDEVAGAREVNTIGVRKDFKVVEVKSDPRGRGVEIIEIGDLSELADILDAGRRR